LYKHRKVERQLWLPNDRAWKNAITPGAMNINSSTSIDNELEQIHHIYYDKVHKKHPVFVTRMKPHKKIQTDKRRAQKHNLLHKLNKKLKNHRKIQTLKKKKLKSNKHHLKKLKDLIKEKRRANKKKNKKLKKKKIKRKLKNKKKHKKRKLKVNLSKDQSVKRKKRKLSGPKATPNLAVDDTRVQIRTFTRLPKQTQIIKNALATGTKVIQPRIYLPSNQYTQLI
jgi:hypothetical protein